MFTNQSKYIQNGEKTMKRLNEKEVLTAQQIYELNIHKAITIKAICTVNLSKLPFIGISFFD